MEDVILGAGTHRTGIVLDRRRNGADLTVVCNDGTGARMYGWCVPQTEPVVASRSDGVLEGMDRLLRLPTSFCCAQVTHTRCRSCRRTVASQFHPGDRDSYPTDAMRQQEALDAVRARHGNEYHSVPDIPTPSSPCRVGVDGNSATPSER
jgi:hypothetical protein